MFSINCAFLILAQLGRFVLICCERSLMLLLFSKGAAEEKIGLLRIVRCR